MSLDVLEPLVRLAWLLGAVAFVLGLIRMNSPATARNGNLMSAGGMFVAIAATALYLLLAPTGPDGVNVIGWVIIAVGIAIGGGFGLWQAAAAPKRVTKDSAAGRRGRNR